VRTVDDTQVVIPMAGHSARFFEAGYTVPKPLIQFGGDTMIGHIVAQFSNFSDILLIVSEEQILNPKYDFSRVINSLGANVKMKIIPAHRKGPSYSIKLAESAIALEKKIIVHYTDFFAYFDIQKFVSELNVFDGTWATLTGFHPHKLRNTKFAHVQKDDRGFVSDIKEKETFTNEPEKDEASAGIYGFSSGKLMMDLVTKQIIQEIKAFG